MTRSRYILFAFLVLSLSVQAQVVYFNGLGRALVTNSGITGNTLDTNTTDQRKATGGYSLFDLGINVQPNELLRASATLRIKNEFGGFYGDGTTINFRQFKIDGILGRKVKYQLGDVDLMLSPYTLFNFDQSYHKFEADLFAIQRSIVHYENFNYGNTWRLQGAQAETKLKFTKVIERIGIAAFATRIRGNDYLLLQDPNRFLLGGRVDVIQSNYFTTGINYINVVDLPGTSLDTTVKFNNQVITQDVKVNLGGDKLGLQLFGEYGMSSFENKKASDTITHVKEDFFYEGGVSFMLKPQKIKVSVSYKEVGANFSSQAAQTRRNFDFGTPSMFSVAGTPREAMLLDQLSDINLRNPAVRDTLIAYHPKYNNINPYGAATPNRKGFSMMLTAGDAEKVYTAEAGADLQQEIVGEGEPYKRKFTGLKGGIKINVHKLLQWEKIIQPTLGFRTEQTLRKAKDVTYAGNDVTLNTASLDAGLTIEFVKDMDVMIGYKSVQAKGNEIYAPRNEYNQIDLATLKSFKYNSFESLLATGLRYRFSKNTFITGQYYWVQYSNKLATSTNYKIQQLFLNYTMVF